MTNEDNNIYELIYNDLIKEDKDIVYMIKTYEPNNIISTLIGSFMCLHDKYWDYYGNILRELSILECDEVRNYETDVTIDGRIDFKMHVQRMSSSDSGYIVQIQHVINCAWTIQYTMYSVEEAHAFIQECMQASSVIDAIKMREKSDDREKCGMYIENAQDILKAIYKGVSIKELEYFADEVLITVILATTFFNYPFDANADSVEFYVFERYKVRVIKEKSYLGFCIMNIVENIGKVILIEKDKMPVMYQQARFLSEKLMDKLLY